MKKLAILTCLRAAAGCCTGAGCLRALREHSGGFAPYGDEPLELLAQFHCNGCDHPLEGDAGMQEKIDCILAMHPDAIHLGVCTLDRDNRRCPTIAAMTEIFMANGITVIDGTHASKRIPDIGRPLTVK